MRLQSRVKPQFLIDQATRRKDIASAPGQAGGLPALNERVELIETILAIHAPDEVNPV